MQCPEVALAAPVEFWTGPSTVFFVVFRAYVNNLYMTNLISALERRLSEMISEDVGSDNIQFW
jgi:hypothetical protein